MKRLLILFLLCTMTLNINAQNSQVFENKTIKSDILKMDRKYAIYLPAGYDQTDRSYPVLYLLHGYSDNQTGWVQFGKVKYITDKAIAEGKASEMIIVMPDADTKQPGYFNDINGKYDYEDFFFKELIPHIEKTYRARTQRDYRAIAGLSMGGGGTIIYALHHPEMFAAACPLSAYLGVPSVDMLINPPFKSPLIPNVSGIGEDKIKEYFTSHNVAAYLESLSPEEIDKIKQVRWYITCGDDDFLIEDNHKLHTSLRHNNINSEYRVKDGGHTWGYWRMELPVILEFISQSFSR